MPDHNPRPSRVHIESLRVRVPGRDAAVGHQFASELAAHLAEQANSLFTHLPSRTLRLDAVSLAVPAHALSSSKAVSSTILQSIVNAAHAKRGK